MVSLVLLEDEEILREEIGEYLESLGHRVATAGTIAEFRSCFRTIAPDVVVLDLMLPDGNGIDLVDDIREEAETGIVLLTAKGALPDKVSGLQRGADYYLTKPVALAELAAVVDAVGRRAAEANAGLKQQRWILDASDWTLAPSSEGSKIKLSAQDFIVLRILVEGCGRPVTRRQIIAALGKNYLDYDQRRMDTQMRRLRKKVFDACSIDLPVKTIHSLGYTFVAEAELRRSGRV